MQENSWKAWIIVAVIAMGATFEIFKRLPSTPSPLMDQDNLVYSTPEDAPYSVRIMNTIFHRKLAKPAPARAVHVAAETKILNDEMKKFTAATAPAQTEAKDKTKKKKKKDEDEYEEVIDPATGKKVKVKKKKEGEEDQKKAQETAQPVQATPPTSPTTASTDQVQAPTAGMPPADDISSAPLAPSSSTPPNNPLANLDDWERLLLQKPDQAETKVFIQDYANHTVNSEVYYAIAQKMLQDSRPDMKQLGLQLLTAAPSSASFQMLADAAKNSSLGAAVQQQAATDLNTYAQPANLGYLEGALRSSDLPTQMEAAQLLDTAVQQALQTGNPTTGTNPSTQNANTTRTRFQPFVPILTSLIQGSGNATLAAQARQTLGDLESLLNTVPQSNVAATTP